MKKYKLFYKFAALLAVLLFVHFVLPNIAHASGGLVPCGKSTDANPCTFLDIFTLIATVTNWLIALAGVYAIWAIIYNAFWLVITTGNEEGITKRKQGIMNAVVGLVIVLAAFMFVNTAVNILLLHNVSGCKVDFTNPKSYLTIASCSQ